jgi:DNA-binding NtrC family response regulator
MLIFVVEDDPFYAELLQFHLSLNPEDEIRWFENGKDCLQHLYLNPAVICLDYTLPDLAGEEVLKKIKNTKPNIQVIIVSAQENIKTAVELIKLGAADYIVKDKNSRENLWKALIAIRKQIVLENRIKHLEAEARDRNIDLNFLVGDSPEITRTRQYLENPNHIPPLVFIWGPKGTGAKAVAKQIHGTIYSDQAKFVAVDPKGKSLKKFEDRLFSRENLSLLKDAQGGTLFLPNIEYLTAQLWKKLLDAAGLTKEYTPNFNLIVSSEIPLRELVNQNKLPEEIFYEIGEWQLALPPLHQRRADILPLANAYLSEFCRLSGSVVKQLSPEAQQTLAQHSWPGNGLEVKMVIELACLLSESKTINQEHLRLNSENSTTNILDQELTLEEYTQLIIRHRLNKNDQNVVLTAQKLGIGKSTIYRLLQQGKV